MKQNRLLYLNIILVLLLFYGEISFSIEQDMGMTVTPSEKLIPDNRNNKLPLPENVLNDEMGLNPTSVNFPKIFESKNPQQYPQYLDDPTELPIEIAEVVHCYQCNSYADPACLTNPEKFSKNCSYDAVGCWKVDQWVDYDGGEGLVAHHRVIRQCATESLERSCYYRAGFGGRMTACYCNHKLCNFANTLRTTNFNIFFVVLCVCLAVENF